MVVFGDSGYFYSNEEDRWIDYNEWLDSNKKNYGISDISPLMIGAFVFPQFFLNLDNSKSQDGDVRLEHKHETLLARRQQDLKEFAIYDITPNQDLAPVGTYARRKDFETGYYPSQVKITCNGCPWKVTLNITKLRLNLLIPHQVWEMQ